jgi:hypothetical protein
MTSIFQIKGSAVNLHIGAETGGPVVEIVHPTFQV